MGATSFRCGLSKLPVARATVGASSMAPRVLPQPLQNARLECGDDRHTEGRPPGPVHWTASLGNSTQPSVNAPAWVWRLISAAAEGGPLERMVRFHFAK